MRKFDQKIQNEGKETVKLHKNKQDKVVQHLRKCIIVHKSKIDENYVKENI